MAGTGVLLQRAWACSPHTIPSRADGVGVPRSLHAELPQIFGRLHMQGRLDLCLLPCGKMAGFQPLQKSCLKQHGLAKSHRSLRLVCRRSEANWHNDGRASSYPHNKPLPLSRTSFPTAQDTRVRTRLQALAGPLLKRLLGRKGPATNCQEDLQLEELLDGLNQRITDLNSQLKCIEPGRGSEGSTSKGVQLLNSVSVPPSLLLKNSDAVAERGNTSVGGAVAERGNTSVGGAEKNIGSQDEGEPGPSALTTMLVDYSMMVASIWAMNGTIKQQVQQVPAVAMSAVNSIGQPALNAVKSVGPPVAKYIGEPAMVAARYAGIPQGIGRVSDMIRSTPEPRGRLGGSRSKRRLSGVAAASRTDRQGSQSVEDSEDSTGQQSAATGQSGDSKSQTEGKGAQESNWWKGTLGSWEPLKWWSSGDGNPNSTVEEKAAAVQLDPLIWPRASAAQEASTSRGEGDEGAPGKVVEAGLTAAGEGFLGTKIAGAKEQPSEVPGWDGGKKGEDPEHPLGFSFSAAGLLFPYHLGVCQALMEAGLITEKTPLAGSSAGAIVSAALGAGVTPLEALQMTKDLADDCRKNGTAGRLGAVLRGILHEVLPEDCHEMCNGRVRVAVTQLFRWPRGVLVDEFYSKADVIEALITSSFIPGFLAPAAANVFRDRYCIDGGMTLFMPPTAGKETIRVCAFPASAYGLQGVQISPDCNPNGRVSLRQLLSWALEPPSDGILDELYLQGHADAGVWIRSRESPVEESKEVLLAKA